MEDEVSKAADDSRGSAEGRRLRSVDQGVTSTSPHPHSSRPPDWSHRGHRHHRGLRQKVSQSLVLRSRGLRLREGAALAIRAVKGTAWNI